ncbi:hypothetical protein [Ideonella sp.]|uniref:hypothetical protein n=1 Tax=Ideonella sp. TaxID=1929293 RepID=UPI0035B2CA82
MLPEKQDSQPSAVTPFVRRAAAAIELAKAQGTGVAAELVISKLAAKLRQAQKR